MEKDWWWNVKVESHLVVFLLKLYGMVDFCVWTGWLRQVGGWKGRANDSIGEGMLLIGEVMWSGVTTVG